MTIDKGRWHTVRRFPTRCRGSEMEWLCKFFLEKCFAMRTMGCTLARMKPMQGPIPHRPHWRNKRREIPATRSTIGHLSKQGRSYPPLSTLPENKNDNEDNPANGCLRCPKNNLPSSDKNQTVPNKKEGRPSHPSFCMMFTYRQNGRSSVDEGVASN